MGSAWWLPAIKYPYITEAKMHCENLRPGHCYPATLPACRYDYSMGVAPDGREGIFTALASAPLFAAMLPTGTCLLSLVRCLHCAVLTMCWHQAAWSLHACAPQRLCSPALLPSPHPACLLFAGMISGALLQAYCPDNGQCGDREDEQEGGGSSPGRRLLVAAVRSAGGSAASDGGRRPTARP